ncbi:uncharacterized protein MONOS_9162 [Monocercomonoides exilis]|uniref:uncharacterized protein n=1 Tax=Monocercomonoides exilis TaxID=2049356 RepID=UPI003559C825|nr:hypothetical protein MONOS_9162 [Monocercomonoides exilis]|eukprot:MONOS_9162.1-p1 / transcript=MONOS_9162.1 / gene=MONOS_9162 / organism=Monocercomonoides_exilis_PA203 / gene_product=unspecified product / transcript_product=unspecified product / location=Mono_scaffold00369:33678-34211(-) / protein_length=178 / sequence_SO=supercontig / SO=protein_coding / is_pseudo=false
MGHGRCWITQDNFTALIALAVLEEREEAEEGEKGGKEGSKDGEEEEGREGGDGNEEKGVYMTSRREFVERIKENQGKQENTMSPLVVEALELSWLRFVKAVAKAEADTEAGPDKQHSVEPEVHSSSPSDGFQREISRAEKNWASVVHKHLIVQPFYKPEPLHMFHKKLSMLILGAKH